MRRLVVIGVVMGALVTAGSASALRPNAAFNADGTLTAQAITDLTTSATTPGSTASSKAVIEKARVSAGLLPKLTVWGTVAITAGSFYSAAWKMNVPGQGLIYRLITGENYGGSLGADTFTWSYWPTAGGGRPYPEPTTFYDRWNVNVNGTTETLFCAVSGVTGCYNAARATVANGQITNYGSFVTAAGNVNCRGGTGPCGVYQRTVAQMEAAIAVTPITAAEYAAHPGTKRDTGTFTPGTLTWGPAAAEFGTPGTQTPAQAQAEQDLCVEIDPDCSLTEGDGLVVFPQPKVDETYTEYVQRLRLAGWLGTLEITELGTAEVAAGPEGVVRVRVLTTPAVTIPRGSWPVPAPRYAPDVDVRLIVNPAVTGGGGTCDCEIPDFDFGPFAELGGTCESFPFGVFCWVTDQLGAIFGAVAVAPHVTVGPHDFGVFLGVHVTLPELEYDFADLPATVDGWRAIIRQVLAFFMVLGGLFFFATRMLGRREAPDPSGVEMGS